MKCRHSGMQNASSLTILRAVTPKRSGRFNANYSHPKVEWLPANSCGIELYCLRETQNQHYKSETFTRQATLPLAQPTCLQIN